MAIPFLDAIVLLPYLIGIGAMLWILWNLTREIHHR